MESWFVQGLYGQLLAMAAMPFYKGRRAAHGTAHHSSDEPAGSYLAVATS